MRRFSWLGLAVLLIVAPASPSAAIVATIATTAPLEDHQDQSVNAAFRAAGEGAQPLLGQVAIGISTGVILSCEDGTSRGAEPIMVGESFKAAYAVAMLAGPGEIVIGREVYQQLGSAVSADPLPPRETPDLTGSWENFRLQVNLRNRA